jgi:hypothetical protein
MDDGCELLPGFLGAALEDGLTGNGIMEAGLGILQKLPGRHPGRFNGPLYPSGREVGDLARLAAESELFRHRIIQSPPVSAPYFRGRGTPPRSSCTAAIRDLPGHLCKLLDQMKRTRSLASPSGKARKTLP